MAPPEASRGGGGAEEGGFAQGFEGGEAEHLAAFKMTEFLAAGSIEVAVEELEPVDLSVGTTRRAEAVSLGMGRGPRDWSFRIS